MCVMERGPLQSLSLRVINSRATAREAREDGETRIDSLVATTEALPDGRAAFRPERDDNISRTATLADRRRDLFSPPEGKFMGRGHR